MATGLAETVLSVNPTTEQISAEMKVTKLGWAILVIASLAIVVFLVAIVLSIICWALGLSEGMFPFVGTSDSYNRDTGAGRGLWFSVVRPWDTRPRHTMMDGQNS
jgi:hypothetical protein